MLKFAHYGFEGRTAPLDWEQRERWVAMRRALESGEAQPAFKNRFRNFRDRALKNARRTIIRRLSSNRLFERGVENANRLQRTEIDLFLPGLPRAFEGYRILHVSDCHFDSNPGLLERLKRQVRHESVDLCVLTGDFQHNRKLLHCAESAAAKLGDLVSDIEHKDGVLAVLGNHDSVAMVEPLEAQGIRVLANEWVSAVRGPERIHITGLDDVYHFETKMAHEALAATPEGFRIILVHSPDFAGLAARHGHDLYLCGHTHGGQVCLPGGRPLIANHRENPRFSTGRWSCGHMAGFTNRGAGTSLLPVRFNAPPEVAFLTLHGFAGRANLKLIQGSRG